MSTSKHPLSVIALMCLLLLPTVASADVPDPALNAMQERSVTFHMEDGTEISGTLVGFDSRTATVLQPNGEVSTVARADLVKLTGVVASTGGAQQSASPPIDSASAWPDCPWGGPYNVQTVEAERKTVFVNGQAFPVQGRENGEEFVEVLKVCGAPWAIEPFWRWWNHKFGTIFQPVLGTASVVVGVALPSPPNILIGIASLGILWPLSAVFAQTNKSSMCQAIRDSHLVIGGPGPSSKWVQ